MNIFAWILSPCFVHQNMVKYVDWFFELFVMYPVELSLALAEANRYVLKRD